MANPNLLPSAPDESKKGAEKATSSSVKNILEKVKRGAMPIILATQLLTNMACGAKDGLPTGDVTLVTGGDDGNKDAGAGDIPDADLPILTDADVIPDADAGPQPSLGVDAGPSDGKSSPDAGVEPTTDAGPQPSLGIDAGPSDGKGSAEPDMPEGTADAGGGAN